jgi:hypothetical protein
MLGGSRRQFLLRVILAGAATHFFAAHAQAQCLGACPLLSVPK